jgi:hypothetical protein
MLGRLNFPAARGSATVAAGNSRKTIENQCVGNAVHIGQPLAEPERPGLQAGIRGAWRGKSRPTYQLQQPELAHHA